MRKKVKRGTNERGVSEEKREYRKKERSKMYLTSEKNEKRIRRETKD